MSKQVELVAMGHQEIQAGLGMDPYFNIPGLSQSGMKDLEISPLRYWHMNINPDRPERKTTPEMVFGSALHCLVLEPDEFAERYTCDFDPSDFPNALDSVADIRAYLTLHRVKTTSTLKADLARQALIVNPEVQILSVLRDTHAELSKGQVLLSPADWHRVHACAAALQSNPALNSLMVDGEAEVTLVATDPNTGVTLKGKADWINPYCILDLKTFSLMRDQPIDEAVTDAIFYRRYYRQAYLYSLIRSLQPGAKPLSSSRFVFAFVESTAPFEVRLKEIHPGGLLWSRAKAEVDGMIWLYADCLKRFGDTPWRDAQEIETVEDEDVRQLNY